MTKIEETKLDILIKEFQHFRKIDSEYKAAVTKDLEMLKRGVYGDPENNSKGLRLQVDDLNHRIKFFEDTKLKFIGLVIGFQLTIFAFGDWFNNLFHKIFN